MKPLLDPNYFYAVAISKKLGGRWALPTTYFSDVTSEDVRTFLPPRFLDLHRRCNFAKRVQKSGRAIIQLFTDILYYNSFFSLSTIAKRNNGLYKPLFLKTSLTGLLSLHPKPDLPIDPPRRFSISEYGN